MVRMRTRSVKLERFRECGAAMMVVASPDGRELRIECNKCRNRFCPACAAERGARIAASLAEAIQSRECRLVTLTLRHNVLPLKDQLNRLYKCSADLRRSKWWKAHATGGAAVCEIKIGRDGRWHPHLHMLVSGRYMPHAELSMEWLRVTGDSSVVDIRAVKEPAKLGSYLAKYIAKPMSNGVLADPDKLDEMIASLGGRRLCLTFGDWRGIKLEPKNEPQEGWKILGRLEKIVAAAKAGEAEARRIIEALGRVKPGLLYILNQHESEAPP